MTQHRLTTDRAAVVAPSIKWLPIEKDTPIGGKMLLINRQQGIAVISSRRAQDRWTHWHPLPTFDEWQKGEKQ